MNFKKKTLLKNRFAVIAFLFFVLDIGYYFLLKSFGISHQSAIYETIASVFLLLFFSFILQRIHTYYHSKSAISIVHVSIIFFFSFLITLFLQEYGSWSAEFDRVYFQYLEHSFYLRWFILFLILLTIVNQLWIEKHLTEQSNSFGRLIEKERQLSKAEMKNLEQQFQPHFLFNSLNSISALVKMEPELARTMIHNLSDFLRLTIQKSKEDFITMQEEIDYLNLYLAIEKVRFGHRLNIHIDLNDETKSMKIPSLLLQPIVENAIKFGLYGNTGDLTISIVVSHSNSVLEISVTNPFDETSVSTSKGTGFGLASIERKLEILFKRIDLLSIQKTQTDFTVRVKIPQI